MSAPGLGRKGQPVLALGGMMACWMAVRVAASALSGDAPEAARLVTVPQAPVAGKPAALHVQARPDAEPPAMAPLWQPPQMVPAAPPIRPVLPLPTVSQPPMLLQPAGVPVPFAAEPAPAATRPNPSLAGGHALLLLSAFSHVPLPAGLTPVATPTRRPDEAAMRRWSGDGWLLLRRGGGAPVLGAIGGSYGASQAGLVLRYRIDTASPHRPSAYLRASSALNGLREQDVAIGLAARPFGKVPLVAMAEARASRTAGGTRLRPALAVVTEFPVLDLPLRLRAEAYGQVGWIGSAGATAFADGQARIERPLAKLVGAEFAAGGGVWGGAQKGASRLDAGPTARVTLHPGGQSTLRLAADWRFRVAGNAAPPSGPALTLSAGF